MLRYLSTMIAFAVCLWASPALAEVEFRDFVSVTFKLEKTTYRPGEELAGELVLKSSKSGFPVTFNVQIFHETELKFTKSVNLPSLFFGTETYSLETFGLAQRFEGPGAWRITIGQANGRVQEEVSFNVKEE